MRIHNVLISSLSLLCVSAWAAPWAISGSPQSKEVQSKVLPDMPPVLSQDTYGFCYGYSSAILLDYWNCKTTQEPGKSQCASMAEDQRFSPIGVSRYGGGFNSKGKKDDNYDELNFSGQVKQTLEAVLTSKMTGSSACASMDKFLSKVGGTKDGYMKSQEDVWADLKKLYEHAHGLIEKKDCPNCQSEIYAAAKEVRSKFVVDGTLPEQGDDRILQSFAKDTFAKALNDLMYPPECSQRKNLVGLNQNPKTFGFPKVASFPESAPLSGSGSFDQMMKVIVSKLNSEIPMVLSFCAGEDPSVKCRDKTGAGFGHALVISGYRKLCDKQNESKCSFQLKVQNSGGQGWQKAYDDGWIDAKTLLDRSYYQTNALTWIEDSK